MNQCIFCKIIDKESPSKVVYEDKDVIAFHDISPLAPIHILIVAKEHINSLADIKDGKIVGIMGEIAAKIAKDLNIVNEGFRVVTNCGDNGGQTVNHLHFHLLAGRAMGSMG